MLVELIYDSDCPNVSDARTQLMRAFTAAGLTPSWKEWDRNSDQSPPYVKGYGSPTILIDGKDCIGAEPSDANCCRIYEGKQGAKRGVPSVEVLAAALRGKASHDDGPRMGLLPSMVMALGIGLALLPNLGCPACWPAYAGLLSAAGLGFLVNSKYLFAITTLLLVIGIATLAFNVKRRGYLPTFIGVSGAAALLIGKFHLESNAVAYAGIFFLVLASVWNSWPLKIKSDPRCPSCEAGPRPHSQS